MGSARAVLRSALMHLIVANLAAILWMVLPVSTWLSRKRLPWVEGRTGRWFLACAALGTLLYIAVVMVADAGLRWEWEKYDLDHNGELSGPELTPQSQEAMHRWATDTGRSFALLVALPASLAWTAVNLVVLGFFGWLGGLGGLLRKGTGKPGKIGKRVRVVLPYEPPKT